MEPTIMPLGGLPTEQSLLIPSFFTHFMTGIVLFIIFFRTFYACCHVQSIYEGGEKVVGSDYSDL